MDDFSDPAHHDDENLTALVDRFHALYCRLRQQVTQPSGGALMAHRMVDRPTPNVNERLQIRPRLSREQVAEVVNDPHLDLDDRFRNIG